MWWLCRASLQNLAQVVLEWHWFWGREAARSSLDSFCFVKVCVSRLIVLSQCSKLVCRKVMETRVRFDTCGHCRQVWAVALLPCDLWGHKSWECLQGTNSLIASVCSLPVETGPHLCDWGWTEPVGQTPHKHEKISVCTASSFLVFSCSLFSFF